MGNTTLYMMVRNSFTDQIPFEQGLKEVMEKAMQVKKRRAGSVLGMFEGKQESCCVLIGTIRG